MPLLKRPDAEICYETYGDGPPFLFCSVTGPAPQAWKFHQVPECSRDPRVIVCDDRGTGRSSKTALVVLRGEGPPPLATHLAAARAAIREPIRAGRT